MRQQARLVYLSPHLDDAVLSCGGLIHQQREMQPLVITCCAGVPDYRVLSPFAAEQHRRWGEPADPIGQRRGEDVAALAHLGAATEHWDYLDCIYRRDPISGKFLYASEEALWGKVASAESDLVDELTARLSRALPRAGTQLYAPLAVGQHVDHQLVLQVALRLRRKGWRVQFYEDYPYAEDGQKLTLALYRWSSPPRPTVELLAEEDVEARIAAIRCYASQLTNLFGGGVLPTPESDDRSIGPRARPGRPQGAMLHENLNGQGGEAVAGRVKAYALAVGSGEGYAERYWKGGSH